MKIDWWTLALQAVNAAVLIWLLAHFLFRPVADIIAARQKAAQQLLADASAAKAAAQSKRERAKAENEKLAEHRSEALKAVEAEAATEKAALLAAAQAEADKLRAAAEAEIANERRAEAAAAADRAGRLAVDIARKLLDRVPSELRVTAFINGLAAGLAALPDGARASLGANGTPIRITAARALTAPEAEACRTALVKILGRPVPVEFGTDPNLIAGLELETRYASVRNSFRADLTRLQSELTHHDAAFA
jgi:F-type H+-transporting ATPase subunit b